MKVNIGGVKYVPGFYGKKRPDAAVLVDNYFHEWEKRQLEIKKSRPKPKVPPTICFSRKIGVGVLERPELLVRQVVIPQLHPAMWENVGEATRFSERVLEQL